MDDEVSIRYSVTEFKAICAAVPLRLDCEPWLRVKQHLDKFLAHKQALPPSLSSHSSSSHRGGGGGVPSRALHHQQQCHGTGGGTAAKKRDAYWRRPVLFAASEAKFQSERVFINLLNKVTVSKTDKITDAILSMMGTVEDARAFAASLVRIARLQESYITLYAGMSKALLSRIPDLGVRACFREALEDFMHGISSDHSNWTLDDKLAGVLTRPADECYDEFCSVMKWKRELLATNKLAVYLIQQGITKSTTSREYGDMLLGLDLKRTWMDAWLDVMKQFFTLFPSESIAFEGVRRVVEEADCPAKCRFKFMDIQEIIRCG